MIFFWVLPKVVRPDEQRRLDFIEQFITALKSVNPHLLFGITLYENELDPVSNPYIDDAHLPPAIKAEFDYIHLYLHYRKNGPNFASYVAQTQAMFPHAKIIAGVYPYDRIDYFPCAQNDSTKKPCTEEEELSYFKQALDIQVGLLKEGKVVALELFPGHFGNETNLYGPGPQSDNLACKDVTRCVQNTITMRDMILTERQQFALTASAPVASAPALVPRVYPNPWRADKHDHKPITFDQLSPGCTIKLFTTSGHLVRQLSTTDGSAVWDMTNEKGELVASGMYVYLVTAEDGQTARGQIAIIH